jgi:hypothetical protein
MSSFPLVNPHPPHVSPVGARISCGATESCGASWKLPSPERRLQLLKLLLLPLLLWKRREDIPSWSEKRKKLSEAIF